MSLRSIFKHYLPAHHKIKEHPHLRHFGDLLHDPDLWHLTRRSTAGGVAVGLFCAFGTSLIMATHNLDLAGKMDKIYELRDGILHNHSG